MKYPQKRTTMETIGRATEQRELRLGEGAFSGRLRGFG